MRVNRINLTSNLSPLSELKRVHSSSQDSTGLKRAQIFKNGIALD